MGKTFYLLTVEGGVEPSVQGPYQTEDERDHAAKQIHRGQEDDDSLFWADIDEGAVLTVGPYTAGFFLEN
jgi:hypothetical protein